MANEKRLIDANALRERIGDIETVDYAKTSYEFIHEFVAFIERLCKLIENAPTVDAVEVVHGEWRVTDTIPTIEKQVMCSSCRCIWYYPKARWSDIHLHNYCPNCGAKMDGDGNA